MNAAPPQRRSNAERSEQMRARLAQAAYEVIAERGHSAFRTAAVVAHAGVSQGALLHHFPNKEAMTLAAIEYALQRANTASMARIAAAGSNAHTVLRIMAEDFREFFMGDRFWVSLDITMDAAKDTAITPAIRRIVDRERRPVYGEWVECLMRCGWDRHRAAEVVPMTAALISGYAIRTLWNDDDNALDVALDRWFRFVERNDA
jgi:AcrR family transcriptional regulator